MKKIFAEIIASLKPSDIKTDAISFSIQIGAVLLNLLVNLLLARIMPQADFGAFAYASTLIFVLAGIGTAGTQNLLVRETGAMSAQNKISFAKTLLHWSVKRSMIFSILLLAFFILISYKFDLFFRAERMIGYTEPMLLSLLCVPLLIIIYINQSYLQGMRKIFSALFAEKIVKPFLFLSAAGIIFFLISRQPLDFKNAAAINLAAFLAAMIIIALSVRRTNKDGKMLPAEKKIIAGWRKSSFTFFLFNAVTLLYLRTDILSLGFFENPEQIGIYNISCRVADTISFPLHILTFGLAPLISKFYQANDKNKLQHTITASTRIIFLLSAVPALLFIFFGTPVLSLFGKHFEEGKTSLIILIFGNLLNIIAGPAGYVLIMTGHERLAFVSMSIACAVNIVMNLILIPVYGISGAAMAACCAMLTWNILITFFTFKKTGIRPDIFFLLKENEV